VSIDPSNETASGNRGMKIYLDMCSLQRPLDDKGQLRVRVEAEAVLGILALCESGQAELMTSDAVVYEAERNPHEIRKRFAFEMLKKATESIKSDQQVEDRAKTFNHAGIKPLDALHLASAVEGGADFFCTCDDRFLRRAKTVDTLSTKVVSPLELIEEIEK
jgi:predicted nucleic acid-binding protein